jgi:hypothetical protein
MTRGRNDGVGGRVAVTCFVVLTFGCSTTHQLGRASQPSTVAALEAAGKQPGASVQVEPLPGEGSYRVGDRVRDVGVGYRIRDIGTDGVWLDVPGPPVVVVPLERVRSISTYDRAHGAQTGALVGGITAVVLMGALALYFARQDEIAARDGGGGPPGLSVALIIVGAGAIGALLGAGLGAMAGYEDRYVVTRGQP